MNRSAVHTIKGYLYQFNLTILKILQANDGDKILIEGIEDIDLFCANDITAIQCKYHEEKEYNHSEIKEAIQLMLRHFKSVLDGKTQQVNYKYFGHFKKGHEKCPQEIEIDFLKQYLLSGRRKKVSYSLHDELGLDDDDLKKFLKLLEININAVRYEEQQDKIFQAFIEESDIDCQNKDDAEGFYYSNALAVVTDLAIQSEIADRKISRKDFLEKINTKQHCFNKWFASYKGTREYQKYIKDRYFKSYNRSPYAYFFLLDVKDISIIKIKNVVLEIQKKFSKHNIRSTKNFCPYLYLHNISEADLLALKIILRDELLDRLDNEQAITCNVLIDGHDFHQADFCAKSLAKQVTYHNQIQLKFLNDFKNIEDVFDEVKTTKEIYQFYFNQPFFFLKRKEDNNRIKHIKIIIESIEDIKDML